MNKTFIVDGQVVKAVDFEFGTVCDMEDMGVSIDGYDKKPMSMVGAYLAICMDIPLEDARKIISKNGKLVKEISPIMGDAISESGFFRSIQESEDEETQTVEKSPRKKKEASDKKSDETIDQ